MISRRKRSAKECGDIVELTRNDNSNSWCRWEEKLTGWIILVIHLGFTIAIHNHLLLLPSSSSPQQYAVNDHSSPYQQLQLYTMLACSFINVVSHSLVVWNRLKKVYVISILIGVSFDVASSILYVWVYYCYCNFDFSDVLLIENERIQHVLFNMGIIVLWGLHFVWNFVTHIRALFLFANLDRLESVVRSADNNLRGIPGPLCIDHIFAYTDLSNHLAAFFWSLSLSLSTRMRGTNRRATLLASRALSYVPSLWNNNKETDAPTNDDVEGIATVSLFGPNSIIMAATVFILILGRCWWMRRPSYGRYGNSNSLRTSQDCNKNDGRNEKITSMANMRTAANYRDQRNIEANTTTATATAVKVFNNSNLSSTTTLNIVSSRDLPNENIGNNYKDRNDDDDDDDNDCGCHRDVLLRCSCPVCNNETSFRISVQFYRKTTTEAAVISLSLLKPPSIVVCRLWLTTFDDILIQVKYIRNKQRNYLKQKR